MEEEMQRANQLKAESAVEKERKETEVKQLKQTLKMSGGEGEDEMKEFTDHVTFGSRKKGWAYNYTLTTH